jgi:hypothetical protein
MSQASENPLFCRISYQNFFTSSKRSFEELNQDLWTKKFTLNLTQDSNKKNLPPVPKFEEFQKKQVLSEPAPQPILPQDYGCRPPCPPSASLTSQNQPSFPS